MADGTIWRNAVLIAAGATATVLAAVLAGELWNLYQYLASNLGLPVGGGLIPH